MKKAASYPLLAGGKRFRPFLTLFVAQGVGSCDLALDAALATEYFHTASLVVDDLPCMDDEKQRRGKETTHIKFGEATTLLVSYALIGGAYTLLARNLDALPPARRAEISHLVIECAAHTTGIFGATGGQYYDLFPREQSTDEILRVLRLKTASLFEQAFLFGWLFGGGDPCQASRVKQAAIHYGIAFQIADDLADSEEDLKQGSKANLALLMGVENAMQMFHVETSAFRSLFMELGIEKTLVGLMVSKLEQHLSVQYQ
ncbi:MAG: polyprenyl synthetase family protein [Chlamydiia bacterium]|nr:polyprenyl synthetase family protein [Chlamydiia bacterium]